MANTDTTEARQVRLQTAERLVSWILEHLKAGRTVCVTTCGRQVRYRQKHMDMFRATEEGALVQRGKTWERIGFGGCKITAHD